MAWKARTGEACALPHALPKPLGARIRAGLLLVLAGIALSGCNALSDVACEDGGKAGEETRATLNCNRSFFQGVRPALTSNEPARLAPRLDVAEIAGSRSAQASFKGWIGPLKVAYAADPGEVEADANTLVQANARPFNPDETIRVNFDRVTLDYFLQQMLGGALGVNYVGPEAFDGEITFRTEQPLAKSQILRVVRDVLGRQGLSIRASNGVLHVDTPQALEQMSMTAAAGETGEAEVRQIRIPSGTASDILEIVQPLVPAGATIVPGARADRLMVKASPAVADQVEQLVNSLVSGGLASGLVALVPLQQSTPSKVAARLKSFYQEMLGKDADQLTVIPLEEQQALLIGAKSRQVLDGVRALVARIDTRLGDSPQLRILSLANLSATEVADQLSKVFGSAGRASATTASPERPETGGKQQASLAAASGVIARLDPARMGDATEPSENGFAMATPPSGTLGGAGAGTGSIGGSGGEPVSSSGEDLKIVPDERQNALMIYSTFETYKRIQEIVKALDVPDSQVVIEATILEVRINDALKLGVQAYLNSLFVNAGRAPQQSATSSRSDRGLDMSGSFDLGGVGVGLVINALQEATDVKVLSTPYLTVLNGRSARLVVGDQIPYATRTQTANNTGNVSVTQEIKVVDTGVVLDVTPRIKSSNAVDLTIDQSVSTPQASALQGNVMPVISTRNVKSQILIQSGRTVLLAGLIQDRAENVEQKTPGLSKIPILGLLNRGKEKKLGRTELAVLITPRVVRSANELDTVSNLIRASFARP